MASLGEVTLLALLVRMCVGTGQERVFFKAGPAEVKVEVGGTAVLECEAGGSPGPVIHWTRHGHTIDQGSVSAGPVPGGPGAGVASLQLSSTRSRLLVSCALPSDAGLYSCVAETPTRRLVKHVTLYVDEERGGDLELTACLETRRGNDAVGLPDSSPLISMWTSERIELEGLDVLLYCRAQGSPQPAVTWFDPDNRPITAADPQYEVKASGDLLVHDVSWSQNMGLYRCVATNSVGTDTASAFLYPTTTKK